MTNCFDQTCGIFHYKVLHDSCTAAVLGTYSDIHTVTNCIPQNKNFLTTAIQYVMTLIRGLSKKFMQYVYKNFILQILGYINVVPFKILPI